ncbi:MAG: SMC-Scp complex subunit ScpB [Candidatus Paceibacterota bacterium]|jgi:segregation and condensation protein B
MSLEAKIEAILFYKAEAVTVSQLVKWLSVSTEEIESSLNQLGGNLAERGVRIIRQGEEVMLGTASEAGAIIEQITKEELSRDLGKAALETLTLIIYEGPLARAEIDYVRGVNSSFILRHLLVRGLIEREIDKKDARRFIYRPTLDLLRHLGIEKVEDLPEFETIKKQVANFLTEQVLVNIEQSNEDGTEN